MKNKNFLWQPKVTEIKFLIGCLFALILLSALCALLVWLWKPLPLQPVLPAGLAWVEAPAAVALEPMWVDARESEAFDEERITGAVNVSMTHWIEGLERFVKAWDHKKNIVVYCDGGGCQASVEVAERLKKSVPEAQIKVLEGGYPAWKKLQKK